MSDRRSLADLRRETETNNTHADLPVGTPVKIVIPHQDGYFWYDETGVVIENRGEGSYLGIIVQLDEPRIFEGVSDTTRRAYRHVQERFGFNPKDLEVVEESPSS